MSKQFKQLSNLSNILFAKQTKKDYSLFTKDYSQQLTPHPNSLNCTLKSGQQKVAFTLAEVLITLGIIGVVAALTMPTLIQNHQKQVYATSAKKAVSIVQNMFKQMQVDEGVAEFAHTNIFVDGVCSMVGEWGSDGEFVNKNGCEDQYGNPSVAERLIPKYLKVVKTCVDDDCDIKYQGANYLICTNNKCTFSLNNTIGTLHSSNGGFYTNWSGLRGFYTSDGMIFYFINGIGSSDEGIIQVYVDVNGTKGPNVHGRDLFGMYFSSKKDGKMVPVRHPSQIDNGFLRYLMQNGWKMDY